MKWCHCYCNILLLYLVTVEPLDPPRNTNANAVDKKRVTPSSNHVRTRVNSSGKQVRMLRQRILQRRAWKRVFDEIRDYYPSSLSSSSASGRTKSNNKISRRFEGFENWERRLAQWSQDIEEYLDPLQQISSVGVGNDNSTATSAYKGVVGESMHGADDFDAGMSDDLVRGGTSFKPRAIIEGEAVLPYADLSDKSKHIWVITTAALPWMTGTAVNPMLRAAYLCEAGHEKVTIMLPWLERSRDQEKLYGQKDRFVSQEDQEQFLREWLRETALLPKASTLLDIRWYTAWQETLENSVYAMGDITGLIPDDEADIGILEEPEHLNWYRAPGK